MFRPLSIVLAACIALLLACSGPQAREPPIDPDVARAEISQRLPKAVENRNGWAVDIFPGLRSAVDPADVAEHLRGGRGDATGVDVPGQPDGARAPSIARREIDTRAARYKIPKIVVSAALELQSPNGKSYRERLEKVKTEKELSDLFADFIGMVPLGERLFAD